MNGERGGKLSLVTWLTGVTGVTRVIVLAMIFSGAGWLLCYGSLRLGIIGDCCLLRYAAQEEIIALEKARIKKEEAEKKGREGEVANGDLFFGEIEAAARLAAEIAYKHETGNTKVILSNAPIYAKGAVSISKEVHTEVIAELKRQKEESKNE